MEQSKTTGDLLNELLYSHQLSQFVQHSILLGTAETLHFLSVEILFVLVEQNSTTSAIEGYGF